MYDVLTHKNYLLFCAKHYDNPHCTGVDEFHEDLKRIKYIKKLLSRYVKTGDLKERLILNHLIILNNVFGPDALVRIIFLKMKSQLSYIKPFLVMLNILPDVVLNVGSEKIIQTDSIAMDQTIIEVLRKI
jgi:hypothetical protein